MKTISLTVPMDYNALTRASNMLHGLAIDLKHEGGEPAKTLEDETHTAAPEAEVTGAVEETPAATEVFGDQQPAEPSPSLFAEQPAETPNEPAAAPTAETATAPAGSTETTTSAPATAAPAGVDLAPATTNPEASIPWDSRIHAGSKAKLAKKPHGWKMKRGVAADLVAAVEAELIAAMAASPANPVEPAGNAAPTAAEPSATPASPAAPAAAPTTAAAVAQPASPAPAQPAAPAGAVSTFPELMAKITASGIDQATVTAAVNKQGLQALPLLAARPDLIPAVAAELFPGG